MRAAADALQPLLGPQRDGEVLAEEVLPQRREAEVADQRHQDRVGDARVIVAQVDVDVT